MISEEGETVDPENSTITRDEEIEKIIPGDNTTIDRSGDGTEEDYQPLIASNPSVGNTNAVLGIAVIATVIAVGAIIFVARRPKKIEE